MRTFKCASPRYEVTDASDKFEGKLNRTGFKPG